MELATTPGQLAVAPPTRRLLTRMLCPLTGMAQTIGFVMRGAGDPRLFIAGGEMTGVHVLRGLPPPAPGSYHIGGSGFTYDEALIRTLGETIERYAHFVRLTARPETLQYTSHDKLLAGGETPLVPVNLRYFTDAQLSRPGFPFTAFDPASSNAWVETTSLANGGTRWVAAQEAFPGYRGRAGEQHFASGVTTGSAAHTALAPALRNALLELVQIDAAMGHWYGQGMAVKIARDARTASVDQAIARRLPRGAPPPKMLWLRNADLPGFAVACVIESEHEPRLAVGLGCDLRLDTAMSKAFLEGAAVAQLAKVILFRAFAEGRKPGAGDIYDLDENVALYASGTHEVIDRKFSPPATSSASDLPPDIDHDAAADVRLLVGAFGATGKELVLLDLTTPDIRDLGLVALRVWSPAVLTLSLPSAPPLAHPRFSAYGGVDEEAPHPYP